METYDIAITADESCMHNYNLSFMAGFLSCVPRDTLPPTANRYIEKKFFSQVPHRRGRAEVAILALRKIEAYLAQLGFSVIVCPPQEVWRFRPKVWLVSAMDPFGIGPATTTMVGLAGGKLPFNRFFFERLVRNIKKIGSGKVIVGGPGAWEFGVFTEARGRLGIDCIFNGAVESAPRVFWEQAVRGQLPVEYKSGEMRPEPCPLKGATFWGMVEISRGCGRGCQFCDMELMSGFKWLPIDFIVEEAKLNAQNPYVDHITLLSEDTLRYGTRVGEWKPNEQILRLTEKLAALGKPLGFTHCCLATALANPKVTQEFSEIAGLDEKHLSGFQTGIESGSPRIVQRYMQGKIKPWAPADWPEVVQQGMAIMADNYIIPHATLVMGLAEERPEDTIRTTELVKSISHIPSLILPLFFVPLSVLKDRPFIVDMLNPEQKELLAVCARHTAGWARRLPNWSGSLNFLNRLVFAFGANWSFRYLDALRTGKAGNGGVPFRLMAKAGLEALACQLRGMPAVEYFRQARREYPVLERIDQNGVYKEASRAIMVPMVR